MELYSRLRSVLKMFKISQTSMLYKALSTPQVLFFTILTQSNRGVIIEQDSTYKKEVTLLYRAF